MRPCYPAGVEILLLRSSLPEGPSSPYLSLEGRRLVRALGGKLRATESFDLTRVVASPEPGAVQTAELFADRLDHLGVVETLPALGGNAPPEVVAPTLLGGEGTVLVVCDEPQLARLGAFFVGRPTFPPSLHAQLSVIRDRQPAWFMRATELERGLLLIA